MGWFWADQLPLSQPTVAPHPIPSGPSTPPPVCPMHNSDSPPSFPPRVDNTAKSASSCPVQSPNHPLRYPNSPSESQTSQPRPSSSSTISKLNPLNYMPSLNNEREHSAQSTSLPLDRETSTIPRGDSNSNWEYPSPQQMYNAMLRKGYTDTPAEHVESMVAVHNFLNEGAWNEIVEWEHIFSNGLGPGWSICRRGEQGIAIERAKREYMRQRREALGISENNPGSSDSNDTWPKLLRFMGRPKELTPKARILQVLSYAFPESYGSEPPFDRHDWFVARQTPNGSKEVRYVIDYYAAGTQETGEPVFYLDIRPALDTPSAALERAMRWGGDVWHRASGASVREKLEATNAATGGAGSTKGKA